MYTDKVSLGVLTEFFKQGRRDITESRIAKFEIGVV